MVQYLFINQITKKRLTIKSQPQKMNGGGEKEMEQKGYSKAETLSGPCWLFE